MREEKDKRDFNNSDESLGRAERGMGGDKEGGGGERERKREREDSMTHTTHFQYTNSPAEEAMARLEMYTME